MHIKPSLPARGLPSSTRDRRCRCEMSRGPKEPRGEAEQTDEAGGQFTSSAGEDGIGVRPSRSIPNKSTYHYPSSCRVRDVPITSTYSLLSVPWRVDVMCLRYSNKSSCRRRGGVCEWLLWLLHRDSFGLWRTHRYNIQDDAATQLLTWYIAAFAACSHPPTSPGPFIHYLCPRRAVTGSPDSVHIVQSLDTAFG